MYIPCISECCSAIVTVSLVLFCAMAAVKLIFREQPTYTALHKAFKTAFMCKEESAARFVSVVRTLEIIGLVSWVVFLTNPHG